MECNWKTLTMNFNWNNKPRHLQGLNPQSLQTPLVAKVNKEIRLGHEAFAICFHLKLEEATSPATMQELLKNYEELFQEPTQLPPKHEIDHSITLKEGTEPINVRPYHYAHFQKAEIEKQVQEMLNSGLIRPRTSPFSSPVLLVKKKKKGAGGSTWTTAPSMKPQSRIDFQFPPSTTCLTNYMESPTSLSWTSVPVIIRCDSIHQMFTKQHSALTTATTNTYSCRLDCATLLQHFKPS